MPDTKDDRGDGTGAGRTTHPGGPTNDRAARVRAERGAAALRANLKRRKAQARGRADADAARPLEPAPAKD